MHIFRHSKHIKYHFEAILFAPSLSPSTIYGVVNSFGFVVLFLENTFCMLHFQDNAQTYCASQAFDLRCSELTYAAVFVAWKEMFTNEWFYHISKRNAECFLMRHETKLTNLAGVWLAAAAVIFLSSHPSCH